MDTEFESTVGPEAIDYNGNMDVAHYGIKFGEAAQHYFRRIGLSTLSHERTNYTLRARESYYQFMRKAKLGDRLAFKAQLLDFNGRSLHILHLMYVNADQLGASNEVVYTCIDLVARTAVPFDDAIMAILRVWRAENPIRSAPGNVVLRLTLC